jgi:hypothetical protein
MPNEKRDTSAPRVRPNTGGNASDTARGYTNRPRSTVDWDEIPADDIGKLVHTVTKQGAACMFGITSDRGALSVTILDGENRVREWPRSREDYDAFLSYMVGMFGGQ